MMPSGEKQSEDAALSVQRLETPYQAGFLGPTSYKMRRQQYSQVLIKTFLGNGAAGDKRC